MESRIVADVDRRRTETDDDDDDATAAATAYIAKPRKDDDDDYDDYDDHDEFDNVLPEKAGRRGGLLTIIVPVEVVSIVVGALSLGSASSATPSLPSRFCGRRRH